MVDLTRNYLIRSLNRLENYEYYASEDDNFSCQISQ